MVELNISGMNPNAGSRWNKGPRLDNPQFREQARAARDAYTARPEYQQAEAQRAKQQSQENSAYRQQGQQEARLRSKLNSTLAAEIREHEAALKLQKAMNTEAARLRHRLGLLQSRQQGTFTPSSYNALHRAVGTLDFQTSLFRDKYGRNPFPHAAIPDLLTSMGSEANSYRTARTLRIGNMLQARAFSGKWGEAAGLSRDLKKIDADMKRHYRWEEDPTSQGIFRLMKDEVYIGKVEDTDADGNPIVGHKARLRHKMRQAKAKILGTKQWRPATEIEKADYQRQIEASMVAHSRAEAGFETMSPLRRKMGMAFGRGLNLMKSVLENPFVNTAVAGGVALYEGTNLLNQTYAGLLSQGAPYRDFKGRIDRWAMANGLSANRMQRSLMPFGAGSYVPGHELTKSESRWGYSAEEAERLRQQYGVAPHSAMGLAKLASTTRWAQTLPGMNLSADQLASSAGFAKSVFGMSPQKYFDQLEKVSATATRAGMNNSQIAAGFQALLSAAGASGSTSVGLLSNYYSHMLAGGGSVMRNGGAANYAAAVRSRMGNFFGSPPLMQAGVLGFLKKHGMATTPAAFEKEFGVSAGQFHTLMKGGGKELFASMAAAKGAGNPAFYAAYLTSLMKNNPKLLGHMLKHSGLPLFTSPAYGLFYQHLGTGASLSTQAAYDAAKNSRIASNAYSYPSKGVAGDILKWASHYGVPDKYAFALFGKESGFNAHAVNGSHIGLGQVGGRTLTDFNKAHGLHYTAKDMLDPAKNARVSMWYYRQQHKTFGYWGRSYQGYHYGAHGGTNAADEAQFHSWVNRESGISNWLKQHGLTAQQHQASLKGSESAQNSYGLVANAINAGIRKFRDGLNDATTAVDDLAHAAKTAATNLDRVGQQTSAAPNGTFSEGRFGYAPYHHNNGHHPGKAMEAK